MGFFNSLKRKILSFSVPKLNIYMSAMFLLGLLIMSINPMYYYYYLSLDIGKLLSGQVWRVLTFLIYPIGYSNFVLLSLLLIYIYYNFSRNLVYSWGENKYTLYIFLGIIGHVIGGILIYYLTKSNVIILPTYLAFSIFIAFALTFPDSTFLLYFIIPVKAKYLAYFEIILYIIIFFTSNMSSKIEIVCSLLNVFVFMYIMYKDKLFFFVRRLFRK